MALVDVLMFGGIALVVAAIVALAIWQERKRRHELEAEARRLGLAFHPEGLPGLVDQFAAYEPMNQGLRRRTRNVFEGRYRDIDVRAFEFLYDTESHDSKGRRRRQTHHVAVAVALVPAAWPKLTIQPEHIGHKLWDAVGGDDIDFESDEFSRKFWVKSEDRKFAYDLLHPRAMELLLGAAWRKWQFWGGAICVWQDRRLKAAEVRPVLDRIRDFLDLLPTFRRPPDLPAHAPPSSAPMAAAP